MESRGGMMLAGEDRSTRKKSLFQRHFVHQGLTRADTTLNVNISGHIFFLEECVFWFFIQWTIYLPFNLNCITHIARLMRKMKRTENEMEIQDKVSGSDKIRT
jgi:hypothetical protein